MRLPWFQVDEGRLLPGISQAFLRLDWSVRPVGVFNWFVDPDPDLQIVEDAALLSPLNSLRGGRSPGPSADLAAILGWGL